jgi:hypothetical protein
MAKKHKSGCMCDLCCEERQEKTGKKLRIYFCPQCKSHEVAYTFGLRNIFGIIPKMKCRKCGYAIVGNFPILEIDEDKLKKRMNKNKIHKKKR